MLVKLAATLCLVQAAAGGVLYPYGTKRGDAKFSEVDDSYRTLQLSTSIRMFGQSYTSLTINSNGVISFPNKFPWYDPETFPIDSGSTLIAAFWADMDLTYTGKIYYRQTSDSSIIEEAKSDIRKKFWSCGRNFNPTSAVVVTWKGVDYFHELDPHSCLYLDPIPSGCTPSPRRAVLQELSAKRSRRSSSSRNTLQVVVLTDSTDTFVVFNYQKIKWVAGDFSGGVNGLGGNAAQVGFNSADGSTWYNHPLSGTNSVQTLSTSSNIGVKGRWLYRIHGTDIYDPDCNKLT